MKKRYLLLLAALISLVLFSSLTIADYPPWTPLPRLDVQYFKIIKDPDAIVDALVVTEEVDFIPGPGTIPRIERVTDWGGNQSWAPSASYGFTAINCRHVYPPEAEDGTEGKHWGDPVSPLNYSGFRVALSYIFGMDDKEAAVFEYYKGPQTFAIDSIIPPAQASWFDDTAIQDITSYSTAWLWMEGDGFYTSGGILYDANGLACRDLILYYSADGGFWESGLPKFAGAFNGFMDTYLGVTNCNLEVRAKDFSALVFGNLLAYHDYDLLSIGLTGLGDGCDWVVSMFHSLYDVPGGWNFAGVHDDYVDHLMETIQYSMDPDEIWQASSDFQHYFNGEFPQSAIDFGATGIGMMPHYLWTSGMTIQSYHPGLQNFIPMPCFGSEQCLLNWAYLGWDTNYCATHPPTLPDCPTTAPEAVRRAVGNDPTNMNPFYENTLYGWLIALDGPCEGLLRSNPTPGGDLAIKPWLAEHYAYEGPINTTTPTGKNIVNGMVIDFYLREGIYWQDTGAYEDLNTNDQWDEGEPKYEFPFTSYDVKFAADMMVKYEIGRYDTSWIDLVETVTEGSYKVTFYYNSSSYWMSTYPSSFSFFPQHIYQKADKQVEDGILASFSDFAPAWTAYEDWMGLHPPDEWGPPPAYTEYWPSIVGTGPFIFGYFVLADAVGATYANTRYWGGVSPVQQSLETYNERYGANRFEKELVEPVITLENTTAFNASAPVCSYWHEILPTLSNKWHIDGWKDTNGDGLVSVSDELTLSKDLCGNDQWVGQGEFHVESIVEVAGQWTITVKEVIYTPKMTQSCICVDGENMVWWNGGDPLGTGQGTGGNIDVFYEVYVDDTTLIASGWVMDLGTWEDFKVCVTFDTEITQSALHTFTAKFYVRMAGSAQEPEYTCTYSRVFYVIFDFPGDYDDDSDVDQWDFWHFCGAFIDYYTIHVLDPRCDSDFDGDLDQWDFWYFCGAFIDYYKA